MFHIPRLLFVFLFLLINGAYGAFIPLEYSPAINGPWFPTFEQACAQRSGFVVDGACRRSANPVDSVVYPIFTRSAACPANSTTSAGKCTCNSGYVEKNGQCVPADKCQGLSDICAGLKGKRQSITSDDDGADSYCVPPADDFFWDQPKLPGCNQGCKVWAPGTAIGIVDDDGKKWFRGDGKNDGSTCFIGPANDPDRPPGMDPDPGQLPGKPSDDSCEGFKGQVNGKDVCVPAQSAEGDKKTDSKTNSDGSSSKTESTTKCDGAQCTTTNTTTNKDASGNITGTSTNVVVVSQGDYCQKNPSSQVCAAVTGAVKPGTGTGTGSGNGNCTGTDCSDTSGPGGPGAVGIPGTGGGGDIGELYKKKYPDGPVALWNQKSAELKNSGLAAAAGKLMPDVQDGGSPPVFDLDFNFGGRIGNLGGGNIAPDGNFWIIVKSIVILCSLILARKIIFGG